MNEQQNPERISPAMIEPPRRSAVPIDLVVLVVRMVEFLTVILAGVVALILWVGEIGTGGLPDYYRTMLMGALIFALVA